jgi:hypothetical protein
VELKRVLAFAFVLITFQGMILAPLLITSLSPYLARITLVCIFFLPVFWLYYYSRSEREHQFEAKIGRFLAFLGAPTFIYLLYNVYHFQPIAEGVSSSEVVLLAEEYLRQGYIVRTASHSYFIQIPYLTYVLTSICGLPAIYAAVIEQLTIILFLALLSMYLSQIIRKNLPDGRFLFSILPYIISFAFIASGTRIWVPGLNLNYRDIGAYLVMLVLGFLFSRGLSNRSDFVVILLLILGLTLGSPTAAIFCILFFTLFTLFDKRVGMSLFIVLPLFYLVTSAALYISSLRYYITFAWEGISKFLMDIISGTPLPPFVPWARVQVPYGEKYVQTITYFSVLLLGAIIVIIRVMYRRQRHFRFQEDSRFKAVFYSTFLLLALTAAVTVGVSALPETTFSDIRTIVFLFVLLVLPFIFASPTFLQGLTRIKFGMPLLLMIIILSSFGALMKPYDLYPKSANDAVIQVEDRRLDLTALGYAGDFLFTHYQEGTVYFDWKSRWFLFGASIYNQSYTFAGLSYGVFDISRLTKIDDSVVIFHKQGVILPSIRVENTTYLQAYNMSHSANIVYDDGGILFATK